MLLTLMIKMPYQQPVLQLIVLIVLQIEGAQVASILLPIDSIVWQSHLLEVKELYHIRS